MTHDDVLGPDADQGGGAWEVVLLDRWRVAQQRSMVGPGDPRVHLERARAMSQVLHAPSLAVDLGSGAGIPGLALAGLWPASRWVLVDSAQRRVHLLLESVAVLGWGDRVRVVHGRAEDLGRDPALRARADLVTSRSFGPPAVTAECGAPFLRPGGLLVVSEPPGSEGERWATPELGLLGLRVVGPAAGVQRLRLEGEVPSVYPRRAGVPQKRPLF